MSVFNPRVLFGSAFDRMGRPIISAEALQQALRGQAYYQNAQSQYQATQTWLQRNAAYVANRNQAIASQRLASMLPPTGIISPYPEVTGTNTATMGSY